MFITFVNELILVSIPYYYAVKMKRTNHQVFQIFYRIFNINGKATDHSDQIILDHIRPGQMRSS